MSTFLVSLDFPINGIKVTKILEDVMIQII